MLIPICDEIRRKSLPAITFLLVVLHLALFISALDGHWLSEGGRLHSICNDNGINHAALQNYEWLRFGTYWLLDKSWFAVIANLAILVLFGPSLEDRAGRLLFLMIYVSSAILGGLFHSLFGHHVYPTVMTSGAVAGLLGAYAVQIDLQTRLRTVSMWYEHPVTGTSVCFLWVGSQVLLANYEVCDSATTSFVVILGGFLNGVLLGFFSRELTPNVVISRAGSLEIVPRKDAEHLKQKKLGPAVARTVAEQPEHVCPYCHNENRSPIQENNGAYYYQCAAKECNRLVFLTRKMVSRLIARGS